MIYELFRFCSGFYCPYLTRNPLGMQVMVLLAAAILSPQHRPMTCGIRNPIIILPEALAAETSPNVINSVLAHELAHVRRHDFLSNLVHELVFLPISFHPAAWFLKQRLQQMRELRCDEMVAGPILEPRCYAQSL